MGDQRGQDYLRTGAPAAYYPPNAQEFEGSSKVAGYFPDADGGEHEAKGQRERVIAIARVWNEVETKRKRSILAGQFPRYLYFIIIYLIALQHQKHSEPYFHQRSTMIDYFVTSEFIDPVTKVSKSFEDLSTVPDLWIWLENGFLPRFFDLYWSNGELKDDYYKTVIQQQNRIANGFRLTQRRAKLNQECVLSGKYGNFLPYCFSDTGLDGLDGTIETADFGPYYNKGKYQYKNNYTSGLVDSGYVIDFKSSYNDSLRQVLDLKADRWIDQKISGDLNKLGRVAPRASAFRYHVPLLEKEMGARTFQSTRWVRVDFMTVNPSLSLVCQVELIFRLPVSGQVEPVFRSWVVKTEQYLDSTRDYIQIVLEVLVLIGALMYIIGDVKDMCMHEEGVMGFYQDPWNVLGSIQMLLFLMDTISWLVVITDPVRRDISVSLGGTAGFGGLRDVSRDAVVLGGASPSLASSALTMRAYFCIQAVTLLVTMTRFFKYMMAVSLLSSLVETLVLLQGTLIQFGIIVFVTNTAFAYMAYILFGDKMVEFYTWDQAFYTLFSTILGEGINFAQIYDANPAGAAIFYVPFVVLYFMILLNLVVAIILEAYQVQQAQRARPVEGWRQLRDGLFRRLKPLRKYQTGPKGDAKFKVDAGGTKGYYEEPDTERVAHMLRGLLDWTHPRASRLELTADELFHGRPSLHGLPVVQALKEQGVKREEVEFLFRRYDWCTRWEDPPPAEPVFVDLIRELQRQVRMLTEAHALAQRKLDAVMAGQTM